MVNTVKKGYRLEKKARDELEQAGYKIFFKSIRTRFGCQDFANLFDIVAYKGKERLFVSVKSFVSWSRHRSHLADVEEFADNYGYRNEFYYVWFWKKREGWIKKWW